MWTDQSNLWSMCDAGGDDHNTTEPPAAAANLLNTKSPPSQDTLLNAVTPFDFALLLPYTLSFLLLAHAVEPEYASLMQICEEYQFLICSRKGRERKW